MFTSYKKTSKGAWKDRSLDGQPLIHDTTAAPLWSTGSPPRFKL